MGSGLAQRSNLVMLAASAVTELFDHPYAKFLHRVTKPNRYTGAEHGTRRKDWSSVEARVCLAFPEIYDIGMSHLGYRILYKILNDEPRTLAERCYAPWLDMQAELRKNGQLLVSLESGRPLTDFDVVGFSLQFELTYTNVLLMLELGGIPLRSVHRSDDDPLVIAGGPVATHAEPMAAFFDAILIGDGEDAAGEIALAWVAAKREGLPRAERLQRLAQIQGVYVPSLYVTALDPVTELEVVSGPAPGSNAPFPVKRRLLEDLDRHPFPDDGPVGGPEAIFDRMSIEVARGCTEGCRFCQAGMIYRPVRERDPEQIISAVRSALEKSGQDEVSLAALSTADVSCISPLIQRLASETAPERVSLSVASLRAYGLEENLLDELGKVRAGGLTFAPEAGTQRMRDVINKNVTEEQLLETAERTFSRGFEKMKLYFICGLPTETEADVLGIIEVGKNALAVGKRVGRRPKVTVSVSIHVPKPHTPFQWCAMDTPETIADKQQLLRSTARRVKGLNLRMHHAPASTLEAILARGDRRLADVIERAFLGGARFDSWDDQLALDVWQKAFEALALRTDPYLGTLPVGARLPWDHFDIGLEDGFLAREYRKAVASRPSPPCGKPVGMFVHHSSVAASESDRRRLVCYDCGVACDLSRMREKRIGFLRQMGALEASQPKPIPDPSPQPNPHPHPAPNPTPIPTPDEEPAPEPRPPGVPTTSAKRNRPRVRPPQPGGAAVRWRLGYEKLGPAALLGHLDLIRELPRVVRRAGVRTAYSEGFHPKPDMSFGPALSLGVASLDEYVDIKLIGAPDADQLVQRLSAAASGGLRFVAARKLEPEDASVGAIVTEARYVIALARDAIAALGGEPALEQRIADFLARSESPVTRRIKGIGKRIDVRRWVRELRVGDAGSLARLALAGIVGRSVPLEATIEISPAGSTKLTELLEALLGDGGFPHVGVRSALCASGSSPLELELLRSRKPSAVAVRAPEPDPAYGQLPQL
jgi:radical SAM family uncharacterized protein/radical SAM-linked protein